MASEQVSYLTFGPDVASYNPQLEANIRQEIGPSDCVSHHPLAGSVRMPSGDLLADFTDLPPNVIVVQPFGKFAGEHSSDIHVLAENSVHPSVGDACLAIIIYFEGRDDTGDEKPGQARGRKALALAHQEVAGFEGRLGDNKLDEVFLWSPHSFESVEAFARLTNRPEGQYPISLTAVRTFAKDLAEKKVEIDAVVSPDRSAYAKNQLVALEYERQTGRKVPLYFFEKHRGPGGAEIEDLYQILEDGSYEKVDKEVLRDKSIAAADDCSDTSGTLVENVNELFDDAGIESLHFHFDAPILSKDGPEKIGEMLTAHNGAVSVYTTDFLPRYADITDPNDPESLHPHLTVFSVAPVLASAMRIMAGENRPQDVELIEEYLLPFVPLKKDVLEAKEENRLPWLDNNRIQEILASQIRQLQTVFIRGDES